MPGTASAKPATCAGCGASAATVDPEGYCVGCTGIVGAWRATAAEAAAAYAAAIDAATVSAWDAAADALYRESLQAMTRDLWRIVQHEANEADIAAERAARARAASAKAAAKARKPRRRRRARSW